MVCGRHLTGHTGKVVAVIGDGAMTAGLAYEGLNQAGQLRKNMIIVLNDNSMSISPNVGALSSFFNRTFPSGKYQEFFDGFTESLKLFPGIRHDIYQFAVKSNESFQLNVTPAMLFEAFNLQYFGPIDGHNLNHLISILYNLKTLDETVLLHVKTIKGKGYPPAEADPVHYHGCSRFGKVNGVGASRQPEPLSYTQVFGHTLVEMAKDNECIVAITAAMPEGTGLIDFSKKYPERFFDVGIAEQHAVTFAAGLALEGFKPVVAVYSTFLQRAYDQVLHDVCLESLPVTFAIDRGGIVGEDGATHHGLFDLSYLRSLPNMVIAAPKDQYEMRNMLKTAIDHNGPFALRYPRGKAVGEDDPPTDLQGLSIGKAEILQPGEDIVLFALGHCVSEAQSAHDKLKKLGIRATVVNSRFLKPLDKALILTLAERIPFFITIEENVLAGGFGGAVLECLADARMTDIAVKRIGIADVFVTHGPQPVLRADFGVDAAAIVRAALNLLQTSRFSVARQRKVAALRSAGECAN
jgi:1-deoxy-D-xylulose-5-phosphate synthase